MWIFISGQTGFYFDMNRKNYNPKPPWLRKSLATGPEFEKTRTLLRREGLTTVCHEARCPNIRECFSRKTATFMIMGNRCTRNCRFCAVANGRPDPPDRSEPERLARAARDLGLRYVVVTSVTRDDLPDGGASCFADTVQAICKTIPCALVEVLIPDFSGNRDALLSVLEAKPSVMNHNIETVERLYSDIRPGADYNRSLSLLKEAASRGETVKTGLMLGLGETGKELEQTLRDSLNAGVRILTMGQYLQPAPDKERVSRFVPPEEFDEWKTEALHMGFTAVASGPFVRSSYNAAGLYNTFLAATSPSR